MHRGVSLGDGRVLHNTPFRGEHVCSEAEFRAGKRMYVTSRRQAARSPWLLEQHHAQRRLRGYNLLTNNCEHTVSRITQGRAESPQLRSWIVSTGLAVAAFAVTRHPAAAAAAYAFGRKAASRMRSD
jgi:hypothetical protein